MKFAAWQTLEQLRKDLAVGLYRLSQENIKLLNDSYLKAYNKASSSLVELFKLNSDSEIVFGSAGNTKTTRNSLGLYRDYSTSEVATTDTWVDAKVIYKKTVSTGTLPNATTKSVAHGVSGITNVIQSRGWAYNGSAWINLPHVHTGSNMVNLFVDSTNINLVTAADLTAYTISYVTIFYTK